MDIKKSPNVNLEDKKLTFTLIGLVVVLSAIYVCFEWTDVEFKVYDDTSAVEIIDEELMEQTIQDETPPPPPPPKVEVPDDIIEEIKIVDNNTETKEIKVTGEDDAKNAQTIIKPPVVVIEDDPVEEIFMVVEEKPEFPGGDKALMKYFSNNVRYPPIALENGIQGRVFCQFTVWKDGSISDITILRGADPSLDKEAIRLISNMPKWKPGKQRGKAVACKFTVPVSFVLR